MHSISTRPIEDRCLPPFGSRGSILGRRRAGVLRVGLSYRLNPALATVVYRNTHGPGCRDTMVRSEALYA